MCITGFSPSGFGRSGIVVVSALLAMVLLGASAAAADDGGYWLLESIKLWRYEVQPNPPPPRPNRYEQDVEANGLVFDVAVIDVDNKPFPHRLWMGWTIADAGNGAVVKAGQEVEVTVAGRHSGSYYRGADFVVHAGDDPRGHPAGWRTSSDVYPPWGFRTDAVLAVHASNGETRGEVKIKFPPAALSGSQPFALLFHTGIAGTAGVEYLHRWSGTAPTGAPKLTLPPEVVAGARADAAPAVATAASIVAVAAAVTATGAERKAILDALRPWVQHELRQPVEFVVSRIQVSGSWAFVVATPQRTGGGATNWHGTPCAGDVSHLVGALLRRGERSWSIVATALCPTDVAWADWPQTYGAPSDLFR